MNTPPHQSDNQYLISCDSSVSYLLTEVAGIKSLIVPRVWHVNMSKARGSLLCACGKIKFMSK